MGVAREKWVAAMEEDFIPSPSRYSSLSLSPPVPSHTYPHRIVVAKRGGGGRSENVV